jgi:hypothetical protein
VVLGPLALATDALGRLKGLTGLGKLPLGKELNAEFVPGEGNFVVVGAKGSYLEVNCEMKAIQSKWWW